MERRSNPAGATLLDADRDRSRVPGSSLPWPSRSPGALDADTAVEVSTAWLPARGDAVAVARRHVAEVLTGWGIDDSCIGDAVLLVSELASNIVAHSDARSIGVDIGATDRRIVVGIRESGASGLPAPGTHVLTDFFPAVMPAPGELRDRGLKTLDALAAEWGISRAHLSTSTWFTLAPVTPPPLRLFAAAVEDLVGEVGPDVVRGDGGAEGLGVGLS